MIRKISIDQLQPGMFVADLHRPWWEHGLWRTRFLVHGDEEIGRLKKEGITEVSIDIARGDDIAATPRLSDLEKHFMSLADRARVQPRVVSLGEERRRAGRLLREADEVVQDLVAAAQSGKVVEAGRLEPLVGKMIDSVVRNPDALVPLARVKQMGSYATEHAVATAALIIALGQQQGKEHGEIEQLALGALVKDIGQASIDARVIAKPGILSRDEINKVHSHVEEGLAVLEATARLPDTSIAVVLEHHERFDGDGYPYRLVGSDISLAGRMAAIVDTYDAMTSERPYRHALSPSAALKAMYAEAGGQFDPMLLQAFIRTVGIYPVGTLVRLESGHLAVIESIHADDLLHPVVKVIFHASRQAYVTPVVVDLARKVGNHYGQIVGVEQFDKWGINPQRWQPV